MSSPKTQIFPHMLRLPSRILTDNGPEFRAEEFSDLLGHSNIELVHSTAYKASGNGAVERVNQTITRIMMGLVGTESHTWDLHLPTALRIYNDTMHSQLKCSPSEFLMKLAHPVHPTLHLDTKVISTWKERHPRFASFRLNELVAYKIPTVGNRLGSKFRPKYAGPCKVCKIQSNGVTYEVQDLTTGQILKKHHQTLKVWHTPPPYLKRFMEQEAAPQQGTTKESCLSDETDESFGLGVPGAHHHRSGSSEDTTEESTNLGEAANYPPDWVTEAIAESSSSTDGGSFSESEHGRRVSSVPKKRKKRVKARLHALPNLEGTRWAGPSQPLGIPRSSEAISHYPLAPGVEDLPLPEAEEHVLDGLSTSHIELDNTESNHTNASESADASVNSNQPIDESGQFEAGKDTRDWTDWDATLEDPNPSPPLDKNGASPPVRCSTPMQESSSTKTLVSEINLSPIVPPSVDVRNDPHKFLQWVETSLSAQEDLISQVMDSKQAAKSSRQESSENRGILDTPMRQEREAPGLAGNLYRGSPVTPLVDEASFCGFGEDTSAREGGAAKLEMLDLMRRQCRLIRGHVSQFRRTSLIQQIQNRTRSSLATPVRHVSRSENDISSVIPVNHLTRNQIIHTRSRGPVREFPYVQARTLEYKEYQHYQTD